LTIAPGLTAISKDLGLQLVQLGIATTSFYIGLSALQLVGGALASKIGSRKIAFIGLVLLGAGAIFSGLSMNLLELVVGRFIAGSGSALFFSPGLSILRDISPPESYGLQVGIYNGAFNLGGAVGAFGWVFVDKALGWQTGLILGGMLVIAISIENLIVLRGQDEVKAESTGFYEKIFTILKNKYLWLLPIGTVIAMFVETVGAQFLVYFGENFLYFASSEAGLVDFVFLLIGFPAGIVAGHYISNPKTRRPYTYITMVIGGLAFMMVPFGRTFALTTAHRCLGGIYSRFWVFCSIRFGRAARS
jgi:Sugar phosphate permease